MSEQNENVTLPLEAFATERQIEYLAAIAKYGSNRAAARALGVDESNVRRSINRLKRKAAAHGYNLPFGQTLKGVSRNEQPDGTLNYQWVKSKQEGQLEEDTDRLPDPKTIVKQSRLFDAEGNVIQQWISEKPELVARVDAFEQLGEALANRITPIEPIKSPIRTFDNLCNMYVLTDCHVGMHAWGKENRGEDWDLDIAFKTITGAMEQMVHNAPDAADCVVAQLGDFLHYDSLEAVTPTSRHVLDADSRFDKMIDYATDIMCNVIELALANHDRVKLVMAEGNHDMATSGVMRQMFSRLYGNNPRLTVDRSAMPYYVHQHGKVMLFMHHGHLCTPANLPGVAASYFGKEWGAAEFRYGHLGDKHHREMRIKDQHGMMVEQHGLLPAPDAYSSRHGWKSQRYASAITYHGEYGEVGRTTVTPAMVM